MDSSSGHISIAEEKTRLFYGEEDTNAAILEWMSRIRKLDVVADSTAPSVAMGYEPIRNAYIDLHARGGKARWVIDITKDNLGYCKEIMKFAEVRYLGGIKGSFAISEEEYAAAGTLEADKPIPELIITRIRAIREQHQFLFETLWNKATPAEQRIREIQENVPIERTEVLTDPGAIENLYKSIVSEAQEEILLILSTFNAFVRHKRLGILHLLKKQQSEKGVKVRMLLPFKEDEPNEQDISDLKAHGIQVNRLSYSSPQKTEEAEEKRRSARVTVVIVDNKTSLVIELENDEKEAFVDTIGPAVLSTGRSFVSSYARIFESLWQETRLTAKLAESDRLQKEFINIAAHELRTPITPILAALYLAEKIKKPDGTSQTILSDSWAEMIERNAKRLEKLANDILAVSNIETKGIRLQKERGNLNSWILEELSTARMFVAPGIKLDFVLKRGSSSLLLIDADKSRIFEVLSNLIRNAIRFSPNGGEITITTLESRDGQSAIVEVHDTGVGIRPEIYPRLFQKFTSSYDYGAVGLGLFISRAIVEAHGGRIWAENNRNGKGATFTFTLPIAN